MSIVRSSQGSDMELKEYKQAQILMLRVSHKEALKFIISLATQISSGNPNHGREEFYLKGGRYFSISVHND